MKTPTTATKPNDSHVVVRDGRAVAFVGVDATNMLRAVHVKAALNLYARSGMLMTRMATPTSLLSAAADYTGKKYKGKDKYTQAAKDVGEWIEVMKAALPVVDETTPKEPGCPDIGFDNSDRPAT
jgi:hypothetical protein